MCLEMYGVYSAHFVIIKPRAFKNIKVKLDLLTNVDILIMIKKYIRSGICHAIHPYAKTNNKYIKYYDKTRNPHI